MSSLFLPVTEEDIQLDKINSFKTEEEVKSIV